MNEQNKKLHYSNDIAAAWREQLAEAAENPWLAELLLKYGERILRRFTYFYEQLRTLSRRARRYIERKLALKLSAAAFLLALSGMYVPVAYAAGITVDGTTCTLAEAITAANTDASVGSCTAGDGADTLDITNDITLNAALPAITSEITIEGNGHTIKRSSAGGTPQFRILTVDGSDVNHGDLTLNDATISGGDVNGNGGGVYNNSGTVTINSSAISGNHADDGGGVFNIDGAVDILNKSTISGNYAYHDGGGVYNYDGTVTINDSIISGNDAYDPDSGSGGGVLNNGGAVTIENSLVSDNTAYYFGGGVANDEGIVTIESSAIISNSVVISATAPSAGGGVFNDEGTVNILDHSTISGNDAAAGGGLLNDGGKVVIKSSTISGNDADYGGGVHNTAYITDSNTITATLTIENSVISGNTAYYGGGVYNTAYATGGGAVTATLTISNSTISGNYAYNGGGVANDAYHEGTATVNILKDSTISGNSAFVGGGVANSGGPLTATVTIENSTISGNDALAGGGGVANHDGTVNILKDSTISGNDASSFFFIYYGPYGYFGGGGVLNDGGEVTVVSSTISGNDALFGGGVANRDGTLAVVSSKISGNDASGFFYAPGSGGGVANHADEVTATVTIGGCVFNRMDEITATATVTISDSIISGNTAFIGGGVFNSGDTITATAKITISNSIISGNDASVFFYGYGSGGGVANYEGTVNVLDNSSVSDNIASSEGGGVSNFEGTVAIENSTISGNMVSRGNGGGVDNHAHENGMATLTIEHSTVSGNIAARGSGGGVLNHTDGTTATATVTIENSTISDNIAARGSGGGLYNDAYVANSGPVTITVAITNSTISGNTASRDAGGVHNYYGAVTIDHSTISGNTAGRNGGGVFNSGDTITATATLTIEHSLVSGNAALAGREIYNDAEADSKGYNLFGHSYFSGTHGFALHTSDIVPDFDDQVSDILDPLADNGGSTETHALVAGSPAIDAGDPDFDPPPDYDQRGSGFDRVVNGRIDIGAFEFAEHTLTVNKEGGGNGRVTSDLAGINCGADCTEAFARGTDVTLEAAPDQNSEFSGWSGDCSGGEDEVTITIDTSKTCTATFALQQFTLEIQRAGAVSGTVTSDPAGIDCGNDCTEEYDVNTDVALEAIPDEGSTFTGWGGDDDCSDGEVTMDAHKTCIATFDVPIGGATAPANGLVQLIPVSGLLAAIIALATSGVALTRRRKT